MKKIKDFLPEECADSLIHGAQTFEYPEDEEFTADTIADMLFFYLMNWLWSETTSELKGVKPELKMVQPCMGGNHSYVYRCGNCTTNIGRGWSYCPSCGTELDWGDSSE